MWYSFRPYVSSVAQRRANAARAIAKRAKQGLKVAPVVINGRLIARTFWGQAWCENLESYSDYENRLPRGRTYVRNGSVVHLEIGPGKVSALVSGSELYEVKIALSPLAKRDWSATKSRCAGQIGSLVELLQGRLSQAVMDIVTSRDSGLIPKPSEIKMSCSCPDLAGMCKDVAAVLYGVGARLDHQPELLFVLREVDHLELIESAVPQAGLGQAAKSGKKTLERSEVAGVFGIELAEPDPAGPSDLPPEPVRATKARDLRDGGEKSERPPKAAARSKKSSKPKKIAARTSSTPPHRSKLRHSRRAASGKH
jgi:uncharacterized Zn finger protein